MCAVRTPRPWSSTSRPRRRNAPAQVSLVGQVATQYLSVRQTEELLTLTQNTLVAVQSSYDLNKALFDAGASNELDFRQSEGQVETARINVETYQRQLQQSRNALQLLLGRADSG